MNNPAVKYGVYFGGFFVLYITIMKFVAPKMIFTGTLTTIVGFLVPIVCMVLAGREIKAQQDGFMSYGEALKNTFLVYVIGSLIYTLYQYVLVNFIDPSLLEVQKEAIIEAGSWVADLFGANEEAMEEMQEQMEEAAEASMHQSFGQVMLGWMGSLILGFILAAIVSAFTKKND